MINKTKKRLITINNENFSVNGLSIDSREVCQGYAFFCIKGSLQDGHKYAQSAVEKGATLIVCEDELIIDRENNVDIVVVEDVREALAKCANQFFDYPSKKIKVIGITGTNGKTTTSHIVNHVICSAKKTCAVIGTTGIYINYKKADEKSFPFTGRTTSDIISTQNLLNQLVNLGIDYVVMEVSSHALDQKRVLGVKFEVCAFTNLTQDHLDYHKTIENYFDTKAILFSKVYPSKKVICIDDKWGEKLKKMCDHNFVTTVGFNKEADINPSNTCFESPLIGEFNIQNLYVAYGICKSLNFSKDTILQAFKTIPQVEGRMQVVNHNYAGKSQPYVVVDYAHTPDALLQACKTLSNVAHKKGGNLICVFGCGGDRDRNKRAKMGRIAKSNSDFVYVTSDNPRTESPSSIIDDIKKGIEDFKHVYIIENRKEAICSAIKRSFQNAYNIVLIAGKGHEKYQEINGKKHHFDDAEVSKNSLKSLSV